MGGNRACGVRENRPLSSDAAVPLYGNRYVFAGCRSIPGRGDVPISRKSSSSITREGFYFCSFDEKESGVTIVFFFAGVSA